MLGDYKRISIEQACRRRANPDHLTVWVRRDRQWGRMPDVEKVWQAARKAGTSFCKFLVRRVFGLTGLEYEQVQAQFGPNPSRSLVGIYQNHDAFVIVMDLSGYSPVAIAGGAGLATAALGSAAYVFSQRRHGAALTESQVGKNVATPSVNPSDISKSREASKVIRSPESKQPLQTPAKPSARSVEPSYDLKRVKRILEHVWQKFDQVDDRTADNSWSKTENYLQETNKTLQTMESDLEGIEFEMYVRVAKTAISKMIPLMQAKNYSTDFQDMDKEINSIMTTFQEVRSTINKDKKLDKKTAQNVNYQFLKFAQYRRDFLKNILTLCQRRKDRDPVLQSSAEVAGAMEQNAADKEEVSRIKQEIDIKITNLIESSCDKSQGKLTTLIEQELKNWQSFDPQLRIEN